MKNTLLSLISLAFTLLVACKKEKLYFQKIVPVESNTTSRLNRIQFLNDSVCIIVGGEKYLKSEILRSADGGKNWSLQSYPEVGKGLYGLGISASGVIYTTAYDGKLMSSHDNGLNWQTRQISNWEYHTALSFAGNNKVIMINTSAQTEGQIVSVDTNIQILKTTKLDFGLNDVHMVNQQTGYVTGYGAVLKTTDGGDNWVIQDIKNDNFTAICCLNENEAWTCGYNGSIFHTTDGGNTWNRLRNGNNIAQTRYNLKNISFKDASNGWAVGENGLVIYTNDGGNTWTKYNKFTDVALLDIAFCPDGTILVVGEAGTIYRLTP